MCIEQIENLQEEFDLPIEVCPNCLGDGEISVFCGHDVIEDCHECDGKGYKKNRREKLTQ